MMSHHPNGPSWVWRFFVVALIIACCLSLLPSHGPAEGEASAGDGVDMVIVLDNSSSMYGKNARGIAIGNDPAGYRVDAAQMVIGISGENNSRVAVLPFSRTTDMSINQGQFQNITSPAARNALIAQIEKLRFTSRGGTNLGDALAKAVTLLADRKDQGNDPMILVLTDGQNELPTETSTEAMRNYQGLKWDVAQGKFVRENYRIFLTEDSDRLEKQAIEIAASKGIPIYTVPLYQQSLSDARVKPYYDKLNSMASLTGGKCIAINATNVANLPNTFAEMLAKQIGSSLIMGLTPKQAGGFYEVDVPILNRSITEANIYIPIVADNKPGIHQNNLFLYAPDGEDASAGNRDVVSIISQDHFVIYKIRQTAKRGNWTLKFQKGEGITPQKLDFTVLYNYNIELITRAGKDRNSLQSDALELSKGTHLLMESHFYDNATKAPSDDAGLYSPQGVREEWQRIKAFYAIKDYADNVLTKGELVSDGRTKFAAELELGKIVQDAHGNSLLKHGDYILEVRVTGAGLERVTTTPLTLTNSNVETSANVIKRFYVVDDPGDPATQAEQTFEFTITEFHDGDNDPLTYAIAPKDSTAAHAPEGIMPPSTRAMDIVRLAHDGKGKVSLTTVKDQQYDLYHYGTALFDVTVTDGDGGSKTVPLEINVTNKTVSDLIGYEPNLTVTGIDNGKAEKNSTVTFTLNLMKDGQADTSGAIQNYQGKIFLYNAANETILLNPGNQDMMFIQDGTTLSYSYDIDNKHLAYKAVCQLIYNGRVMENTDLGLSFVVENNPPVVETAALADLPSNVKYIENSFPPVLLESATPVEELTFDLTQLFTEEDNETITISDPKFTLADGTPAGNILKAERDGDRVTLQLGGQGDVTMSVTATDGDGETATYTRQYQVVELSSRWVIYWIIFLATLLALIILINRIIYALKPAYDYNTRVETKLGQQGIGVVGSEVSLPSGRRRKKEVSVSELVSPDVRSEMPFNLELLSGIKIKPRKQAINGSVTLRMRKQPDGLNVTYQTTPLGHKPVEWSSGEELAFQSEAQILRLVLNHHGQHDIFDAAPVGGADPFGGAGADPFSGFGALGGDDPFGGFGN